MVKSYLQKFKALHINKIYNVLSLAIFGFLIACSSSDDLSKYYSKKNWHSPNERPYIIRNVLYIPQLHYDYQKVGYASWYGGVDHGKPTATGRIFNHNKLTAAHRSLPLPCVVLVENLENGRSLKLLVNDRGPFADPQRRIIDVSKRAAEILGFKRRGLTKVRVTCLPNESQLACLKYKRKPYYSTVYAKNIKR